MSILFTVDLPNIHSTQKITLSLYILDSERSNKCIDFTMICGFFLVSVITVWGSKRLQFSSTVYLDTLFDGKVNLVGAFGRLKFKIPNCFQKRQEKQHKNKGKTEIFTQKRIIVDTVKSPYIEHPKTEISLEWKITTYILDVPE